MGDAPFGEGSVTTPGLRGFWTRTSGSSANNVLTWTTIGASTAARLVGFGWTGCRDDHVKGEGTSQASLVVRWIGDVTAIGITGLLRIS